MTPKGKRIDFISAQYSDLSTLDFVKELNNIN